MPCMDAMKTTTVFLFLISHISHSILVKTPIIMMKWTETLLYIIQVRMNIHTNPIPGGNSDRENWKAGRSGRLATVRWNWIQDRKPCPFSRVSDIPILHDDKNVYDSGESPLWLAPKAAFTIVQQKSIYKSGSSKTDEPLLIILCHFLRFSKDTGFRQSLSRQFVLFSPIPSLLHWPHKMFC